MKIGILTGGGDCPGLNAVIRSVVRTAILGHGHDVVGVLNGYRGLLKKEIRPLTLQDTTNILAMGGTILGASNHDDPFHVPDEDGNLQDQSDLVLENTKEMGIDAVIAVGGDGTMHIARGLSEKGMNVVGVPKTIDNDLSGTDQTFGFDTAVSIIAEALDRLQTTAQAHHRIMVVETMGRYAGWLALYGGMAGAADVILLPERPYTIKNVVEDLEERRAQGKRFSIVVVAEGAREEGGEYTVQRMDKTRVDPKRLGGAGQHVMNQIESAGGPECRLVVLGHLQRGGAPTAFDRILGTRFGSHATEMVNRGTFGQMVSWQNRTLTHVSLQDATASLRLVDMESDLVQTARTIGTSFGD